MHVSYIYPSLGAWRRSSTCNAAEDASRVINKEFLTSELRSPVCLIVGPTGQSTATQATLHIYWGYTEHLLLIRFGGRIVAVERHSQTTPSTATVLYLSEVFLQLTNNHTWQSCGAGGHNPQILGWGFVGSPWNFISYNVQEFEMRTLSKMVIFHK